MPNFVKLQHLIESKKGIYMQTTSILLSLCSAILGALAAGVWSMVMESRRRKGKRISLANAFYGEISALLSKVGHRGYIEKLRLGAKENQFVLIDARQDYFVVYRKNCERIGLLPPALTAEIVKFYIFAKAFIEDTESYCTIEHKNLKPQLHYNQMADLLEHILHIGMNVMTQVEAINRKANVTLVKNRAIGDVKPGLS